MTLYTSRFFLLVLLSCSLQTVLSQAPDPMIVVHRGACKYAPENTLASCRKAIELGADYIEMDIRQTSDGKYVLMHDKTVNRTTNGKGAIAEMTWEEVQQLDAGSHFSKAFKGEKVPSFREVLRLIKGKCLPDVDFKAGDPAGVVRILEEEGFLEAGNVTFHSGNREILQKVRDLSDQILIRPTLPKDEAARQEMYQTLDPPIGNVNWWNFSKSWVQTLHDEGRRVFVNTLHFERKRNMRKALREGADFIQTDRIPKLRKVLAEFESGNDR